MLIFMLAFLFAQNSFAETAQIFTLDNIKSTQLEMDCLNADIKLIEDPSSQLKVTTQVYEGNKVTSSSDWKVSVSRDSIRDIYKIHCNYPEKATLDKKLHTQYRVVATFKGGAPRNTSIHSRFGKLEAIGWSQNTHIVFENGAVSLKNTSGNMDVHVVKGSIDAQKHSGRLRADLFEGKLTLAQVDGNLDLTNFNGSSVLKTINGDINFNSRSGSVNIEGSQGSFKFDSDQGKVDINGFNGAVEGISDQAQIFAKLANPARFKAKIKNASVKIAVPSSSGAQIYLALNEGQFQVPGYLNQDNYGAVKTAKGTLRGGESGRISITGEAGKVTLSTF